MTNATFKVGGVSKTKGQYKVRFANDMTRVKILAKTDTDINLIDLPQAMSKGDLVRHLKTTDLYTNAEYREAIDAADEKYNTVKVSKPKAEKAAPSMEAIKARATEAEVA
jgi:hypothetical protein